MKEVKMSKEQLEKVESKQKKDEEQVNIIIFKYFYNMTSTIICTLLLSESIAWFLKFFLTH